MDTLLTGLKVALIGMVIVFFGLTILIGLIKLLTSVTNSSGKEKKKAVKADKTAQTVEITEESEEITGEDDGALVAAITAAIVSVLGTENRFTVRHIRRIVR